MRERVEGKERERERERKWKRRGREVPATSLAYYYRLAQGKRYTINLVICPNNQAGLLVAKVGTADPPIRVTFAPVRDFYSGNNVFNLLRNSIAPHNRWHFHANSLSTGTSYFYFYTLGNYYPPTICKTILTDTKEYIYESWTLTGRNKITFLTKWIFVRDLC